MDKNERLTIIGSALIGLLVRVGIEMLNPAFPLGQDTLSHALCLQKYMSEFSFSLLYLGPPVTYLIGLFTMIITGLDEVMVWKVLSPIINSSVVASLAYMMMKGFEWDWIKTIYLSLLYTFYFVSIVFSNGLYPQQLAMTFFFLALTFYVTDGPRSWKTHAMVILTALTHPLVSTMLFGVLVLDGIRKFYRDESFHGVTVLVSVLVAVVFVTMFVLPSVQSDNPFDEMVTQIVGYTSGGSFGKEPVPITLEYVFKHFRIYAIMLTPLVLLDWPHRDWWPKPLLIMWLVLLLALSFIPIGWIWMRWQWMSTTPLLIFAASGLFSHRKIKRGFIRRPFSTLWVLVLVLIALHGVTYAVSTSVVNRTSIRFDDVDEIRAVCTDVLPEMLPDSDFLFISGHQTFRLYEYLLSSQYSAGVFVRQNMMVAEEDILFLASASVRGQDFYTFRETTIHIDVRNYSKVILICDSYSGVYGRSDPYLHFFTEVAEVGGTKVYELNATY